MADPDLPMLQPVPTFPTFYKTSLPSLSLPHHNFLFLLLLIPSPSKMCSSKTKVTVGIESSTTTTTNTTIISVARINGRPVLQPTCNRVPNLERRNSIKKLTPKSLSLPSPPLLHSKTTPPISPKSKSPRPQAIKRGSDNNGLNLSSEKISIPRIPLKTPTLERKKSKSFKEGSSCGASIEASLSYSSSLITDSPGSIAAVRREQVALQQAQRKMKIAHYGRSKSAKFDRVVPIDTSNTLAAKTCDEEKRCSFITANSGKYFQANSYIVLTYKKKVQF